MKTTILFSTLILATVPLLAAPRDDVTAAATALGNAANYTWQTTQDYGPNAQWQPGPMDGKTEQAGFTVVFMNLDSNTFGFVRKGTNVVIQTPDNGWQTVAESAQAGSGPRGPGMVIPTARTLQLPAVEAMNLIASANDFKVEDDKIIGTLTEVTAKGMLGDHGRSGWESAPRGTGGSGLQPSASNTKGTVTFWIADRKLTKYQTHVTGSINYGVGGRPMDADRTKTVTIKDVGTTKVVVPDDAKKKLQ